MSDISNGSSSGNKDDKENDPLRLGDTAFLPDMRSVGLKKKPATRTTAVQRGHTGVRGGTSGARKRRKKRSLKKRLVAYAMRAVCVLAVILVILLIIFGVRGLTGRKKSQGSLPSYVSQNLLTVNPWSRPGTGVTSVNAVIIHAAPSAGLTAKELRDSYEARKDSQDDYDSSNLVIGQDGKAILCVPLGEIAYASDSRNTDSVSITYCYDQADGTPEEKCSEHLVDLTARICVQYHLTTDQVLRHFDVTGRKCPEYYVVNSDSWDTFLEDVAGRIAELSDDSMTAASSGDNTETADSVDSSDTAGTEDSAGAEGSSSGTETGMDAGTDPEESETAETTE